VRSALEAERQATFGRLFADDEIIVVPRVIREWCASSVLTSEWLAGRSLDTWLADDPSQAERDRRGTALFRFYIGTLYRHGLCHADPHPGNYAVLDDGRVVVYDFGCVRSWWRSLQSRRSTWINPARVPRRTAA
jgi:predicted unusual protein kinase regulating ubiquinone biosynthesis (AarF/ABC1/UbiB family)